jgi:hypothetical protein
MSRWLRCYQARTFACRCSGTARGAPPPPSWRCGGGTATLEAALFKTPMVIAYRQSPIGLAIMRRGLRYQ